MEHTSIKTTDIAKNIVKPPQADKEHLIFGKVFEEVYTECTWLHYKSTGNISKKKFSRKLAAKLKSEGVKNQDLIAKGYKIYACLLKEGITGQKPKSQSKTITLDDYDLNVEIYAQPDLKPHGYQTEKYYEFKTAPINEYSRIQSQIFHWVMDKPILLVGVEENDKGYINAQKEKIDCCEIDITEEVKNILKKEGKIS